MTLSRNLIVALTMSGGAAIAAVLAFQRRARQQKRAQLKEDLQRWDDDTGNPTKAVVENPLS